MCLIPGNNIKPNGWLGADRLVEAGVEHLRQAVGLHALAGMELEFARGGNALGVVTVQPVEAAVVHEAAGTQTLRESKSGPAVA